MQYNQKLQHVTVLGAAGKMGSGILLLTALEMANQSLKPENKNNTYVLNAMDVSEDGLTGLVEYLKVQVQKVAEKKIEALKTIYADKNQLTEDADFINQYVSDVLAIVKPSTTLESAYQSTLIFEVIKEDPSLKVKIFKLIDENNSNKPWFFTNTSSIPINKLNEEANLGGRILGVHFYNPPAIQKLVEVIRSKETPQEMIDFCSTYIKNLKKIAVPSNDFAGFIGNGHFMRDAIYGITEAERLAEQMPQTHAIYTINKVTQDFLIRPMGIFQLIDYVGIDVCSYILSVMQPYFPNEQLHSDYLNNLLAQGIRGGQHSTGAQKDGIFKYEKGKILAIYDSTSKSYVEIEKIQSECDQWLGALPLTHQPWKVVNFSPDKETILSTYFNELKTTNTQGAQLAKAYLKRCVEIGQQLVNDGIANNAQDVNTVMLTGFYHAYGPINNYI